MIHNGSLITLKFFIFSTFIGLISLSPSLKLIPQSLFLTNFHDDKRLIELMLISLILLHSLTFKYQIHIYTTNQSIHYITYLLITLATISSWLALSPRHAFIEVSLFAGLIYLALFVARLYLENNSLFTRLIIYAFWMSIFLCMFSFYTGYIVATISFTPLQWPAPLTGFTNIRSFNQYQLWTLGLIILPLLTFNFKNTYTCYWLHLGLSTWWILLFYSASRGALLAWFIGLLITAVVYRELAWPFIRLQLIYISTGFLSYQTLFNLIPYLRGSAVVTGTIMRDTTSDRIELWSQSLNLIQNHPMLGVGPMHFAWHNHTSASAHPHNSVLQLMAEWGLPATFLILCIAGYGLFCWLKKFNNTTLQTETKLNRNLAIVLFFTIATNATYSLVDGVIVMPISQVMMFTFIGLMLGFYSSGNTITVIKKSFFKPIFACIVLVALVWSTLPEILQSASGSEKRFSMGYTASGPRIWLELK